MNIYTKFKIALGLNRAYEDAKKETERMTKSIFTSKTFYFNLALGVYAVLQQSGVLASFPPEYAALIGAVGNILLRLQTTQPASLVAPPPTA